MLVPEQSILVRIEPPKRPTRSVASESLDILFSAAAKLSIPLLSAIYGPPFTVADDAASPVSPSVISVSVRFDHIGVHWEKSDVAVAIAGANRKKLIICGYWLEEAVTLLALHALRSGIDVYLCEDAIAAFRSDQAATHYSRLQQHNAVRTTTGQVVREWAALCGSAERRAALEPIIEQLTNSSS